MHDNDQIKENKNQQKVGASLVTLETVCPLNPMLPNNEAEDQLVACLKERYKIRNNAKRTIDFCMYKSQLH